MTTTLIMPCLNEEKALRECIRKAKPFVDEIIVADNRSTDRSWFIAFEEGVEIVIVPNRGYGNAYRAGLKKAKYENIIMADCDGSYDMSDLPRIIEELEHYDLVIGNRFANPDKGSMQLLNRFGNSILRIILNMKGVSTTEVCTGFIGIKRDKVPTDLECSGMEFSSEFLLKTKHLKQIEIPIKFHKRIGESKLRRFRDGLRHVKYILQFRDSSENYGNSKMEVKN